MPTWMNQSDMREMAGKKTILNYKKILNNNKLKIMKERLNYAAVAPNALKAMRELEKYVHGSGLERPLYELVKTRASQINGCAYCLDMHTKDARKAGETEQRLYALSAWRETPFYTERERAALEWTEALTVISESDVPDVLYDSVRKHFNEKEIVALTMAIIAINGWNRLAISFRTIPGSYTPQ
jgi:AhpD family alkylhydroperoxidase